MARGSCHTSRPQHPVLLGLGIGGRRPVRSRSATTTSSSASKGAMPGARATSPTARPSASAFSEANVSSMISRSHTREVAQDARPRRTARRRRAGGAISGSESAAMRSSTGSANTSRQPGRPSRMAPCSKLSRSCMVWGSVSATTVAPRSAAAVPAASWLQAPSGFMAETPSTFQLTGRSASSDMVARKSTSSSREAVEAARRRSARRSCPRGAARRLRAAPSPPGPPPARGRVGRRRRCACAPGRSRTRAPRPRARRAAPPPWRRGRRRSRHPRRRARP